MKKAAVTMKSLAAGMLLLLGTVLGDPAAAQSVQGYNNLSDLPNVNTARGNLAEPSITTGGSPRSNPYYLVPDVITTDDGQITSGSTTLTTGWTGTASVGASFTISSCSGTSVTIVSITSGLILQFDQLTPTTGIPAGTFITNSNSTGGASVYTVNQTVTCAANTLETTTSNLLALGTTSTGVMGAGQILTDSGALAAGTTVLGPVYGGINPYSLTPGIYQISSWQHVVSENMSTVGQFTPASVGKMVVVSGAGAQNCTQLSSALSTGSPITSLPVSAFTATLPAGWVYLNDGAGHTQNFTLSAQTLSAATAITTDSITPNFAYPATTTNVCTPALPLVTTIAGYTNANSVTLAAPAGTTPLPTILSGAEVTWGTDNATALQAGINAAEAANVCYDIAWTQTGYLTSVTPIVTSQTMPICGHGVVSLALHNAGGNQHTFNDPTRPPYLLGSYLVVAQIGGDGIDFQGTTMSNNIHDFGIRFTGGMVPGSTGHGIHFDPPHVSATGLNEGPFLSWAHNVTIFGVDGNHYGFEVPNPLQWSSDNIQSYGGGFLDYGQTINSQVENGNGQHNSPYGTDFVAGSANCFNIYNGTTSTSVPFNKVVFIRPQCNVGTTAYPGPYSNIAGNRYAATPTGSQYTLNTTSTTANNISGVFFFNPDFEPASALGNWPVGQGSGILAPGSSGPVSVGFQALPTVGTIYHNTTGAGVQWTSSWTLTPGASTPEELDFFFCTSGTAGTSSGQCPGTYKKIVLLCPAGTATCTSMAYLNVPNSYWYTVTNPQTGGSYTQLTGDAFYSVPAGY